jgi:hypothetical protein
MNSTFGFAAARAALDETSVATMTAMMRRTKSFMMTVSTRP